MKVELERVGPRGRRARVGTFLGVAGPPLALVIVVVAALAPSLLGPRTARPVDMPGRGTATAEPSGAEPRIATTARSGTTLPPGVPRVAYGLAVRAVDELLADRNAGSVLAGLVAVAGVLSTDPPPAGCRETPDGAASFCQRLATLRPEQGESSGTGARGSGSPAAATATPLYLHILPGTQLAGPTTGGGIVGASGAARGQSVVLGRFTRARQAMCSAPFACGDEFILERLAWTAGAWIDRVLVRDPDVPDAVTAAVAPRSLAIASREADRQEQVISIAILQPGALASIDPDAARAAEAAATAAHVAAGPVWYLRSIGGQLPGSEPLLSWAVIHHESGRVLASGTVGPA